MRTTVERIREKIESKGGIMSFPATVRRGRVTGRPTRFNLKEELHELTDSELNVAFVLGLIGNNGHEGSIVKNATKYHY